MSEEAAVRFNFHLWMIPALILLLLVGANLTRWDYKTSSTNQWITVKWKADCWTGQIWSEIYMFNGSKGEWIFKEFPANRTSDKAIKNAWVKRNNLTKTWYGVTGLVLIWLFVELRRQYRKKVHSGIAEETEKQRLFTKTPKFYHPEEH